MFCLFIFYALINFYFSYNIKILLDIYKNFSNEFLIEISYKLYIFLIISKIVIIIFYVKVVHIIVKSVNRNGLDREYL